MPGRAAAAFALAVLAAGCSSKEASRPDAVAVDIRLDQDGLRVHRIYPVREFPRSRHPARTFLRYELQTQDGIAAGGLIPDFRAVNLYDLGGTLDSIEARRDWGEASLRLPADKGELVLFEPDSPTTWDTELARVAFDPDQSSLQRALVGRPYFLYGEALGDPVKLHGTLGADAGLDIMIVAEGYTESDMEHFHRDADFAVQALFDHVDYAAYKDRFNVWRQDVASLESGVSDPDVGVSRKTAFGVSISGISIIPLAIPRGLPRFNGSFADWNARDLGGRVGAEVVVVLTNVDGATTGVGGIALGGVTILPNTYLEVILPHELGHEFFKLGDEYANPTYSRCLIDLWYHLDPRTWFPNFAPDLALPWWDLVEADTPLPTPDETAYFDKVGAFEGALHCAEGTYRPQHDCLMRGWGPDGKAPRMCRVCRRAMDEFFGSFGDQGWFWEDDCPQAWRGDGVCDHCLGDDPDCNIGGTCNHDGRCDDPETCANCPNDCGICQEECGDGVCTGLEDDVTCSVDCGCTAVDECTDVAPLGCWCDATCAEYEDCCWDACGACGRC